MTDQPKSPLYYLQTRGGYAGTLLLWREGRRGYTADIRRAHVFTKRAALAQQRMRPDEDFPWRKDYIDSQIQHHVYCEDLDRDAEAAFVAPPAPPTEEYAGYLRGLERAIDIISAIEAPSDYYEPFKTRLVDALFAATLDTLCNCDCTTSDYSDHALACPFYIAGKQARIAREVEKEA